MKRILRVVLGLMLAGNLAHTQAGPCDMLATAGTPCVGAHNFARKSLTSYAGSFYQLTGTGVTEIYDQTASGNDLPVNGAFGKNPATLGSTTLPNGRTVPIARIVAGQGYYRSGPGCGTGCATKNLPAGNSAITIYMVIEDNSEGGGFDGCCGQYNDGESPQRDAGKGFMFGTAWSTGGMGSLCIGSGPCPGVDLEDGVYLYGPSTTEKYLTIIAKYDPTTSTMTLKSGDATQGPMTTLYSGALPPGYTALNLEQGLSLGGGGDASNAPVNFLEGAMIAGVTTDETDDALQANIVGFYGTNPAGVEMITAADPDCNASNPCALKLYRASMSAGQTACPAYGDPSYTAVATDMPGSVVGSSNTVWAYSDATVAAASTYCYFGTVSFVASGRQSQPSDLFQAQVPAVK